MAIAKKKKHNPSLLLLCLDFEALAPVVRKPINANPRLNRPNPQSNYILRLNYVPRRPISTIQ